MNYYSFHIGDYTLHTAHLSDTEDLIYRRLIDLYYQTEAPLNSDPVRVARLIRFAGQADLVESVLGEFFEKTDAGYLNKRCEAEIQKYRDALATASRAGKASAAKRALNREASLDRQESNGRSTGVERPINDSSTNRKPRTIEPSKPKTIGASRFDAAASLSSRGVSDDVAHAWLQLRRAKKAPVSALVLDGIEREAAKARLTLSQALTTSCERGWTGFKADWVSNVPINGVRQTQGKTNKEITARAIFGSLLDAAPVAQPTTGETYDHH